MEVDCDNCNSKPAVTLADGMPLCADCYEAAKEQGDAESDSKIR
jgi:hypothetical protein